MSAITPVGIGLDQSWQAMVDGVNGIQNISQFDAASFPCRFAGEVNDFDPLCELSSKEVRKMDRFMQFGIVCGKWAVEDSGIDISRIDADRAGVNIGSGIGGIKTIEATAGDFSQKDSKRVSPFYIPMTIINMISGNLSIMCGLRGPNLCTVTACTTGTHAIGEASRLIEYGDADIMVAGGAEAPITPTSVAGFASAKALSTRNDEPGRASRPWDRDRDGFVIGEGSGVMVLEEYEHARARGARIYAELLGFGLSGDAYHMTGPSPGGDGASRCMNNAIRNAGLNSEDIDYLNAHGTSTPLGDIAETLAVKSSFKDRARDIAISSNKSMIGHLLGAAGGVEAVMTVMSIHKQTVTPTINLQNHDPDCDLDYVPNQARSMNIRAALSNSFGFGGTNGTLVFGRV